MPLNLLQVASAQLYQNNWHLVFAYIVMIRLPMILIFVVAQRRIIRGVASEAVEYDSGAYLHRSFLRPLPCDRASATSRLLADFASRGQRPS